MKDLMKAAGNGAQVIDLDAHTQSRVIESMVLRGDLSGLGPLERARHYVAVCEGLGLNPASKPFDYLKLNGKEVLYANRGCTDQLAAIHRVNREIIDGPKVMDLAGTKLVYAVCRVTLPNGRTETATATVPLVDPVNVLMKCETKSKRRATLSILGLGMLDEMELETIPANVQEPGGGVDLSRANLRNDAATEAPRDAAPVEVPAALEGFYARIAEIELPGEAVAVWMKHRTELATLPAPDREAAWKALCKRTEDVGKMKNAKVWLKKAIAEEDARSQMADAMAPRPDDDPTPAGVGSTGASKGGARASGAASKSASGNGARAALDAWRESIAAKPSRGTDHGAGAVAGSWWAHREELAAAGIYAEAYAAVLDELTARRIAEPHSWLDEIGERNGYVTRHSTRSEARAA